MSFTPSHRTSRPASRPSLRDRRLARVERHALERELADLGRSSRAELESILELHAAEQSLEARRILAGQTAQIV